MLFTERKEFLYDPEVFGLEDTQIALSMYGEWVRISSPFPYPKFFEVDRSPEKIDDLWHVPLTERTVFVRTLDVPVIATFERPNWQMKKLGIVPQQRFKFIVAAIHLHPADNSPTSEPNPIRLNYFPLRGDQVFYIGYRLMVTSVVPEPQSYWHQTNVWTGLVVEACIAPDGDARPIPNLAEAAPAELPGAVPLPDWPGPPPVGPENIPHNYP